MKKQIFPIMIMAVVCSLGLVACAPPAPVAAIPATEAPTAVPATEVPTAVPVDERRGGTLNVGLMQSLQTLDPHATGAHPTPHIALSMWEGLFALGAQFEPVGELAESWSPSADSKSWTINIRQGVKFHNGKELTAEDVKSSMERWLKLSPTSKQLATITGVDIASKYTVKLNFSEPIGALLLRVLASDGSKAVIMPKEIADDQGTLKEFVGTGPYQFVEYVPDDYVKLVRFEDYTPNVGPSNNQGGLKHAWVDEITYYIVPEASTRLAALEQGDLDFMVNLPEAEYDRVKVSSKMQPIILQPPAYLCMFFNHKQGPLTNLKVRQALVAALDMDLIMKQVKGKSSMRQVFGGFFPLGTSYSSDEGSAGYYNQKDPAKAKELLKESGYKNQKIRILGLQSEEALMKASTIVAEQLKAAGFNAELLTYDLATWVAKRAEPTEQELFITGGIMTNPIALATNFGGTWPSWYRSDGTDAIFAQMRVAPAEADLKALVIDLQKAIYEDVAGGWLGFHNIISARGSRVNDPYNTLQLGIPTFYNLYLTD